MKFTISLRRYITLASIVILPVAVAQQASAQPAGMTVRRGVGHAPKTAQVSTATLMTQQQVNQQLSSNPTFVKQVSQFDSTALSGTGQSTTELKSLLAALHLQRPSQLNPGLIYVHSKRTGVVSTHAATPAISGNTITPDSYLTSIVWNIWADGIIGDYFVAHSMTRANCALDWWGIIPDGWCFTATAGDLFNGGVAFVPFLNTSGIQWLTAQTQADPSVVQSGPGLYKMIAYADWSSTEDSVFGIAYLQWPD